MTDNTNHEEREDDDDRRDLLLEKAAAEQRQTNSSEARDERVKVVLEGRNLDRVKGRRTDGVELGKGLLDAVGASGKSGPVDEGTVRLLNLGDDRDEGDANPALDEGTDDEHTEDGSALGDLAEHAAAKVVGDLGTDLVAELLRVPEERHTDDVPGNEEQDRAGNVAGQGQRGTERTRAYARIAKLTLAGNNENDELKKIYTEIGKLYFEQQQGTADGFFAPLFAQAKERVENIRAIEAEIDALREKIAEESGEKDIEVEIGAFDDIVSADEKAAKGEE